MRGLLVYLLVSLPQKNTSKLGKRNFISETKQKKLVDDMSNERNHEIVQKKKPINDFEQRLGKNPFCLIIK